MIISNNKQCSITLPMSANDIKVMAYVEFRKIVEKRVENDKKDIESEIETIIEAVSVICEGDLSILPFDIENDIEVGIEGFQINVFAKFDDLSMLRLFTHIQNLIYSYTPELDNYDVFFYKYKGELFYLSGSTVKQLTDKHLQTGEVIEILEFERMKKMQEQKEGDNDGAIMFTRLLWIFAVLMRKEGEILPIHKAARQQFLTNRIHFFQDLPMSIVLDLSFFLANFSIPSLKTLTI